MNEVDRSGGYYPTSADGPLTGKRTSKGKGTYRGKSVGKGTDEGKSKDTRQGKSNFGKNEEPVLERARQGQPGPFRLLCRGSHHTRVRSILQTTWGPQACTSKHAQGDEITRPCSVKTTQRLTHLLNAMLPYLLFAASVRHHFGENDSGQRCDVLCDRAS